MLKSEFVESLAYTFCAWCPILSVEVAGFMACQCALETGYGSSDFYKNQLNYFGMRYPRNRITLADGSYHGHCNFSSYHDSFYDYLLWLQMRGFNRYDFLDINRFSAKLRTSGYNPSDKYVDTILSIYKMYFK